MTATTPIMKQTTKSTTWPERLLLVNMAGACLYVAVASNGWRDLNLPEDYPFTGEPFVWFGAILPVVITFFLIDGLWTTFILRRRRWADARYLGYSALCWLIALAIDFTHH